MNHLAFYPDVITGEGTTVGPSRPGLAKRMQYLYRQNASFRIIYWFALILILASLAVIYLNQTLKLSNDAVATIILPTSILGAAAMASLSPKE